MSGVHLGLREAEGTSVQFVSHLPLQTCNVTRFVGFASFVLSSCGLEFERRSSAPVRPKRKAPSGDYARTMPEPDFDEVTAQCLLS